MQEKVQDVPGQDNELKEYKVVEENPPKDANDSSKKKRKILKITGWILGGLAVLLALVLIFRDIVIENGIRHVGSMVTGTKVQIESFKTSLKGTVELKNIKVSNPAGYQKPYAFEIDRIYVKILPSTLLSEEPIVENVEVSGVRVDMEMKGAQQSNLTEIQANVEKFAGAPSASEEKQEKKEEISSSSSGPSPLIRKLDLTSMSISFSSSTLKSSLPVPLAPIHLRNIGGKGSPLGETLLVVFRNLMSSINTVGGTVLSGVETIGNAGKGISDSISGFLKKKK